MTKTSSSQLKAHLGRYLRAVRAGAEVLITDRDRPVARLTPVEPRTEGADRLRKGIRDPAAPPLGQVVVKGIRYRGRSTTAILRADRDRR